MTPEQKALQEAIDIAGGQSELARKLSSAANGLIKQQQVWNWLHREKKPPSKHVVFIETLTGISRERLRPDIFQ
jgi:DNA-binding transcriptional regulator YdaS (Cro superfamily)